VPDSGKLNTEHCDHDLRIADDLDSQLEEAPAVAETRTESDSMGEMVVPAEAYYGSQTERARLNFQISPYRFPRAFIRALGLIKKSAALTNVELDLLAPEMGRAIAEASQAVAEGSHDDQFVVDIFQTGSGTSTNMNANEVIAGIANEKIRGVRGGKSPVHPNDSVNMGQSSNDVIPTAIHVAAVDAILGRLVPTLSELQARLAERAEAFDDVVKIGRTHLQDAVPIRLGQEFSGYASQVAHARQRLERGSESLLELPIGGTALGTGLNAHPKFGQRVAERLGQELKWPFRRAGNPFEAMANRDAAVEASGSLRAVAVSLSNIANNLRWLASGPRCGIGEIRIPELQPGSSIMPGKVNPVIPEAVMMAAARVVGNDATIAWANALGSNFDLNVMMPVIAFSLLESIELLIGAADHLATRCVDARGFFEANRIRPPGEVQIVSDPRAAALVEASLALCTALAPRIGYDVAAAIAKTAYREGRNVRDIASELVGQDPNQIAAVLKVPSAAATIEAHGGFPSLDELDRLLDPMAQTVPGAGSGGSAGG
jgi:fumarate hydratase class II